MMRRGTGTRERVDLCQVVREVREMMRSGLVTRGITVVPDFATDLPPVVADRIQIQQVVVNLVTNAMQAMDGLTNARLTLGVRGRVASGVGRRHRAGHRGVGRRHDVRAVHQLPA